MDRHTYAEDPARETAPRIDTSGPVHAVSCVRYSGQASPQYQQAVSDVGTYLATLVNNQGLCALEERDDTMVQVIPSGNLNAITFDRFKEALAYLSFHAQDKHSLRGFHLEHEPNQPGVSSSDITIRMTPERVEIMSDEALLGEHGLFNPENLEPRAKAQEQGLGR